MITGLWLSHYQYFFLPNWTFQTEQLSPQASIYALPNSWYTHCLSREYSEPRALCNGRLRMWWQNRLQGCYFQIFSKQSFTQKWMLQANNTFWEYIYKVGTSEVDAKILGDVYKWLLLYVTLYTRYQNKYSWIEISTAMFDQMFVNT